MSKKKELFLIKVDHGIANRFSDCIEVNRNLIKYPDLYRPIIRHELEHTDSVWSLEDFKHDLNSEHKVDRIQLMKFMLKYPKSFTQVLPIYYTKERKFVVDINLCIIYFVMFLIGWGIYAWLY